MARLLTKEARAKLGNEAGCKRLQGILRAQCKESRLQEPCSRILPVFKVALRQGIPGTCTVLEVAALALVSGLVAMHIA